MKAKRKAHEMMRDLEEMQTESVEKEKENTTRQGRADFG